jgi:tripartite-type tricarboxylate transporter receptor subunit TctC
MMLFRGIFAMSVAALCAAGGPVAFGQAYPTKSIRMIVPHPTGGGPLDGPARAISELLGKVLGQQVIVENRDGADGIIGMEMLVKSPSDGYTIATTSASVITMNELVRANLPYSSARDVAPIAYVGAIQSLLLVHPSVPAKNLRELLDLAKAKPNAVSWGTLGTTSNGPLFIGVFRKNFGASFYMIPYKSTIQALQGTVAGDVNVVAYAAGGAISMVKAGKLRALAYTGDRRHGEFPDVPTFEEAGAKPGFRTWIGMFAPAGAPRDILRRLNTEVVRITTAAGFAPKYLDIQGIEISEETRGTPEQFAEFIRADRLAYEEAVKAAGIQKQ